jgi:PKD repeat protein
MYLGDLGSRVGSTNKFFVYDGLVTSADLSLFLQCYKGLGPTGPVAIFTWSPLKPISNQLVTFNASQSYDDKYGTITSYAWDFGDGNTTTGPNPIVLHTFTSPGNYTVTLKVTDNESRYDSKSQIISLLT